MIKLKQFFCGLLGHDYQSYPTPEGDQYAYTACKKCGYQLYEIK